jgi:Rieske Fe-S protein
MTENYPDAVEASGTTRRAMLLGAGTVGAAGLLAACGGGEPTVPPTNNPPARGNTTAPGQAPTTAEAIKVADIPVGGGKFYQDRHALITQPTAGDIKAFDATCTHQGCTVSDISGGLMTCECHGSQFRITDGSVARGPNTGQPLTRGLAKLPVTVNGDTVTVG